MLILLGGVMAIGSTTSVRDLANDHAPVSDFLGCDPLTVDPSTIRITPQQMAHYKEYGYVAGIKILNDTQIEMLRTQLSDLFNPHVAGHELFHEYHSNESADPSKVLFHALGAWRIKSAFHDLLWHPQFTVPAGQLLGGSVRFWHDQLFCKPAKHGGVVAWHQDYSYWNRTIPMNHLTCWIGLDDATVENGCMHYIPGSHRWPLLPATGLAGDMESIRSVLNDEQMVAFKPLPIELKAGEATFHHPLLIHGSKANLTERPRRAVVINVCLDGTRSDSDEPLLVGMPPVAKGSRLEGKFFPLLREHY